MKRYHQYPLQKRIAVLGIIAFSFWTFYIWTFSPHAHRRRIAQQQQSIETQIDGLNSIYVQLAGQCFAFAADRDSLVTAVNWKFIRLWRELDERFPPYGIATSLSFSDEELEEFGIGGN